MARLRIAPIVEGYGEVDSVPSLLRRIWKEIGGDYADVPRRAILKPRSQLAVEGSLRRIIEEAAIVLTKRTDPSLPGLILILLDADDDCPAELGPRLERWARDVDRRFDVACVVAHLEFETWFAAAAESLVAKGFLKLKAGEVSPDDPEGRRLRKRWVEDRFAVDGEIKRNVQYKPTRDQPAMTRAMDLAACRSRSPSFDKLCRELEKRLAPSGPRE
jgi:Domain of unknown function (DUF4276)